MEVYIPVVRQEVPVLYRMAEGSRHSAGPVVGVAAPLTTH